MELEGVANTLFDVEKKLRELATDVQLGRVSWREAWDRLTSIMYDLHDAVRDINRMFERAEEAGVSPDIGGLDVVLDAVEAASKAAAIITDRYDILSEEQGVVNVDMDGYAEYELDDLEKAVERLVGVKCRYRISNKLSSKLNDLASCVHRVAEYLSKLRFEREGRCTIVRRGSEKAIEFCRKWSRAVDYNASAGLYDPADDAELEGWVVGDTVYLKTGSGPGHRTMIDMSAGIVDYWEADVPGSYLRFENAKRLFEEYVGLECVETGNNLRCKGVTADKLTKLAAALSMLTSMDLRISDPDEYWSKDWLKDAEYFLSVKRAKELEELIESET